MYTLKELEFLEQKTMEEEAINSIADEKEVKIDGSLTYEARIEQYFEQSKNPYFFRHKKIKVQTKFIDTKETLEDIIAELLVFLKREAEDCG